MSRRLQKELRDLETNGTPVGIKLLSADDFQTWYLSIEVLGDTVYQGEVFALRFRFDSTYPIVAPSVTFVVDDQYTAPIHPHVYSNGHICASILGNEWSPVLTVNAVCLTLQSMLASCKRKERPPDNDRYVSHAPSDPRKTRWDFHDDSAVLYVRALAPYARRLRVTRRRAQELLVPQTYISAYQKPRSGSQITRAVNTVGTCTSSYGVPDVTW
ncbi:hypothetical protein NM688_g9154 [Phlebia brevispora]|uniref:Uncharacterized protein n=1 Tax=Phlebia brevispora TaxID=194682 RepID=A0ACC1RIV3_9APHY|nr:hypothetical protein NM688_g9154 [Phlebia brevispora]